MAKVSDRNLLVIPLLFFFLSAFYAPPMARAGSSDDADFQRGVTDYRSENFEEAAASFEKALRNDPASTVTSYWLGLSYKQMLDYKKALKNFSNAVEGQPAVKEAVFELAEMNYHLKKYDEALGNILLAEKINIRPAEVAFMKGLVLSEKGKATEAVASFEKAKALDSSMAQSADYQMGVVLVKLGRLKEADQVFRGLIVVDPNSDLAIFAKQYVDMLESKAIRDRPLKLTLSTGYEADSNVILKPSDQSAAGAITGESDGRFVVNFTGEYALPAKGKYNVKGQYSLYLTNHGTLDTHDVESHTFAIIPSRQVKNGVVNLHLGYNHTLVKREQYLRTITLAPGYTFSLKPGLLGQLGARYQHKDYKKSPLIPEEDRDANEYALNGGLMYLFMENKGVLSFRYEYNRENTDGVNWNYEGHRATASLTLPVQKILDEKARISASTGIYKQRYEKRSTVFGMKREDLNWTASFSASYDVKKNAELQLRYAYTRADSNVAVYDYRKNVTGAYLIYKY